MVPPSFLALAVQEALKSDHYHRMGAIIFNKKSILSRGYNKSFRFAHNLHPKYTRYPNSIHAEVDAILKARKSLKGAEILVVRLGKRGELRLALPCVYCMSYLQDIGIKRVYYSDRLSGISDMKITEENIIKNVKVKNGY